MDGRGADGTRVRTAAAAACELIPMYIATRHVMIMIKNTIQAQFPICMGINGVSKIGVQCNGMTVLESIRQMQM